MKRKCLILFLLLTSTTIILVATPPVVSQISTRPGPSGYFKCWACSGRGTDSQGNRCSYCGGSGVRNIHKMRESSGYGEYRRNPGADCFVATAAYGSPWQKNVYKLKCFRDHYLLSNSFGKKFVAFYYRYGPRLANAIRNRPWARLTTRVLLTPFVIIAGAALGNNSDLFLFGLILFASIFTAAKIKNRGVKLKKTITRT